MELCNCNYYFDGFGGIYLKENMPNVYDLHRDKNIESEDKINRILNDFILLNKNEVNHLFLEYIRENIPTEINEKEFYFDSITKIIELYNFYNKVIIRFPPKTRSSKINPLLRLKQKKDPYDLNDDKKKNSTNIVHSDKLVDDFVMFVDAPNSNLNGQIELHNQYINVIAHELGHSVDEIYDLKRYNDGAYIIKREIFAWNKAEAFLYKLEIFNTDIKKQKEICVNNYRKKFNYYE